jgi:hypothetical protein
MSLVLRGENGATVEVGLKLAFRNPNDVVPYGVEAVRCDYVRIHENGWVESRDHGSDDVVMRPQEHVLYVKVSPSPDIHRYQSTTKHFEEVRVAEVGATRAPASNVDGWERR